LKLSGYSTSEDKKWKKLYMLHSVRMMKPSLNPAQKVSVIPEDPPEFTKADNHPALNEPDQIESVVPFEPVKPQNNVIIEPISDVQPLPTISPSSKVFLQTHVPQDRWSREKHIELVNINGEPLTGITTKSRIRDSDATSASECLYVNFLSKMEPKKLIEALEEKRWIIAMQEELNQFERSKGYNHQERIDYKENFAPVARLEAIKIFLAYAAYMSFMVYQMDVKCALLNRKTSEEVYVQQPLRFESSEYPNHVCKLDKALYGLKQASRAWYQANPTESHLVAVKRIFRYLKGTPNLGLCYPKGSGFDLKAYSDSDYVGYNLVRKSTSGGCQTLGGKLVCWSAKKQISVALSSAEAEYEAAAGCCAQVLWIKSELDDYDVLYSKVPIFYDNTSAIVISNNPVLHSRTKHIDIRIHIFTTITTTYTIIKEVKEENKTITFLLSWWDKPLSFTQYEFISAISLPIYKDVVPLPPKETVRDGLATLAKLYEEPEQSLIPPPGEVNADDTADKSFSRASVQLITQSKAPTDLKTKQKRIPRSSKPKSPHKVRVILPKKQVAKTQYAEVTVATANVLDQNVKEKDNEFVAIEEVAEEQSLEFPIVEKLLDEADKLNKAVQETPKSPYDTQSKIKVVKSFFTSRICELKDQTMHDSKEIADIHEGSESDLQSMPDDDMRSVFRILHYRL
nr:uncharacterized mitochondrial protein AtMg00810-like [Tanacetum cinerariifolium]